MIKRLKNSKIEIWSDEYINYPEKRREEDKKPLFTRLKVRETRSRL